MKPFSENNKKCNRLYILYSKTPVEPETNTFDSACDTKTAILYLGIEIIARLLIFLHFYVTDCNYCQTAQVAYLPVEK
jgi:hypothetical protein